MLIFLLVIVVVFGSIYLTFDKVFKNIFKPKTQRKTLREALKILGGPESDHVHTWEKVWSGYGNFGDKLRCTTCDKEKYVQRARR